MLVNKFYYRTIGHNKNKYKVQINKKIEYHLIVMRKLIK
jgi:hypothetical protein